MKAIVRYKYGSPDVLELGDIDKPEIGDGEVLVRIRALIPRPGNTSGGSPSPNDRYGRQARRAASPAHYLLAFRIRLGA